MNIQRLSSEDTEKLQVVINDFPFDNKSSENIQNFLSHSQNYFLVAYSEDKPIGYLLGYELQKPETIKPKYMFYDIEVLGDYRRQGVGKSLIEEFKRICISSNGTEIFVPTNKSNLAAMKLYESTGGKQEDTDNVMFIYKLS